MLLSIICIDFSVSWFPTKILKSDFPWYLAMEMAKPPQLKKSIYSSYFKKLSGWEGEGPGGAEQKLSSYTPTLTLKKLQIIFSEDF